MSYILNDYMRMCGAMLSCTDCPIHSEFVHCGKAFIEHPEECEKLIRKWAAEHPTETYASHFTSLHKNALIDKFGVPCACVKDVYGIECLLRDSASSSAADCAECWKREYNGE